MTLTAKREAFAQCIADGMSQADAYRSAFNAGKMKPETIYARASELMADSKVSGRVKELRSALADQALWTREKSVQALVEAMGIAREMRNSSAVTGAIKELNAMHGYNAPQKVELTGKDGTPLRVESIKRIIIDPKNAS